jgi:hypothetical protein
MRTLTVSVSIAFILASGLPAIAANFGPAPQPYDGPPLIIGSTWGSCEYIDWGQVGDDWLKGYFSNPLTGKPFTGGSQIDFGWITLPGWKADPTPPPAPLYGGPFISGQLGPSTTMTLNTGDPPPVMTLDTDNPSNTKPPDPPKPPDPGPDVVPVVGDLGGPVQEEKGPKPLDPTKDTIGMHVTGSEPGQTIAFLGPERAMPWSGPGKLDGGYDIGFAGCTTRLDNTCTFTVARNQLSTYGLGKLAQAGPGQIFNLVASNYPAAPAEGGDACRSKQWSVGRSGHAMPDASATRERIPGGSELPVAFIRIRNAR